MKIKKIKTLSSRRGHRYGYTGHKGSFLWPEAPLGRIESGKLSTTCSNAIEVTQWATPSCSRPQPATDNGVRDGRSN